MKFIPPPYCPPFRAPTTYATRIVSHMFGSTINSWCQISPQNRLGCINPLLGSALDLRSCGNPRTGRFPPRHPADPLGQLLPLPRARLEVAQGRPAAGYQGDRAAEDRRRDRAGQERRQRVDPAGHQRRSRGTDAAPEVGEDARTSSDRAPQEVDRPGRLVEQALGVRATATDRGRRRFRTEAGRRTRSMRSSSPGSRRRSWPTRRKRSAPR